MAAVAEPTIPQIEAPPATPPAPTTSISVTPATVDKGKPVDPPKPGSARERLYQAAQQTAAKNSPKPAETPKKVEEKVEPKIEPKVEKPAEAAKDEPKEKVNPWSKLKEKEGIISDLQKQLEESKKSLAPESERKAIAERLQKAETRAKELEDEIRYVNYQKTEEFQTKYQQPYNKAWELATAEMSEITLTDPTSSQVRMATAEDLLTLVNLPLDKARDIADSLFGKFADDVMAHRKEIRNLFRIREAALEEAKKTGAEREKQLAEQSNRETSERSGAVKQAWEKANQDAVAHEKYGKYFVPVEGDQQGNQRLAKGFELVDRAFTENPLDPKLTAEQRAGVINRHAAVRNRAAAFGRLVYLNEQLESKVAELQKELDGFKSSEPDIAGSQSQTTAAAAPPMSARDRLRAKVMELAK
jgi:hypothetical protein